MSDKTLSHPHRRYNALTGEWILVSPHRTSRPWQGKQEVAARADRPAYDSTCLLCAGNQRIKGGRNPDYKETYVFDNDFPAILQELGAAQEQEKLFQSDSISGVCRVICFSPRHDWSLPEMPVEAIRKVVDVWAHETETLGKRYKWVQVFENKGEIMGCSNPHPHGQIWAGDFVPNEPAKEEWQQFAYFKENGSVLLCDYLRKELERKDRVVAENEHWAVVVPYWATWPYETLLMPRRHVLRLPDLHEEERDALADILKRFLSRYDNLFETSFPYSMGWHGAPTMQGNFSHWQLHAHFYPPLLRSATVKKFMVGYEMLAEAQRDLTPEQAAAILRQKADVRFTNQ